MRVRIRPTTLQGQPLKGQGEVFSGRTALDVLLAMQRAAGGGNGCPLGEYMDELVERAEQGTGDRLEVVGETQDQRAVSFLDALIKRGLAEELADSPAPVSITLEVWQGLAAVRQSGLTHMLDRPMVVQLAREMGHPETAEWIEDHPKEYAEGIFRGFCVEVPKDGKP